MSAKRFQSSFFFFSLLILISLPADAGHPDMQAGTTIYSFGVIPQFGQRRLVAIWQPILDQLQAETGLKFKLSGSPRISSFDNKVEAGEFDFVYMNPYLLTTAPQAHYQPLVRDNGNRLEGVVVVHRDSPIKHIHELAGQEIVLPSPNSLGASLLLRHELEQLHNIKLNTVYVQTHSSVYLHVAKGLAIAGGGVNSTLAADKPFIRDKLRVIYRTRGLPTYPIAVHSRVPAEVSTLVRETLLKMTRSSSGKKLLSAVPMEEPVAASLEDYQPVQTLDLHSYAVSR